jgi:hypothetical protein
LAIEKPDRDNNNSSRGEMITLETMNSVSPTQINEWIVGRATLAVRCNQGSCFVLERMRELEKQNESNGPHLPDDAPTLDAEIASLLTFPTNSATRNDELGEGSALRALGSGNKSRSGAGGRKTDNSCEDAEARS